MTLKIINFLFRAKEPIELLFAGKVNMAICGPTGQDYSHVGQARTYMDMRVI